MSERLIAALADQGIVRLKRLEPGRTQKARCPRCEGGRDAEDTLNVSVDHDGKGAVWKCHRQNTCGWTGGFRLPEQANWQPPKRSAVKAPPLKRHTTEQQAERPDWLYEFFAARGIGARTVNQFGIYAASWMFHKLGEQPAIVFPYRYNGEVVARKYRPKDCKNPQSQENNGLPTLFNADVLKGAPEIIFVEGEPDVLAMAECGYPNVVSLRDGAPAEPNFKEDDARFAALKTHAAELEKVKRFVLAGDMDKAGFALREELIRRLGRHKVSLVTWPEGCKDAGDVLAGKDQPLDDDGKWDGVTAIQQAISSAEPYPIDGLYRITAEGLAALRLQDRPDTMTTGTDNSDRVLHLPVEGRLIVVTGFPNHGKTAWVRFVMMHTAKSKHKRKWLVFSPEHQPWEQFAAECAEVHSGKPFWPHDGLDAMSDLEIKAAGDFLSNHVTMMVCDSEDQSPTLDWIIERAIASVMRDGVTDLLIDPWNEVEHNRGDLSETDYTGRSLQRLKAFGLRRGCNVWVIAHPAKPPPLKAGEKPRPPTAYDISGSAHWYNKTDVGITIWVPQSGDVDMMMWKSRFRRWGSRGSVAKLSFDQLSGQYRDAIAKPKAGADDIEVRRWDKDE